MRQGGIMSPEGCFSETYKGARAKFLAAAHSRRAHVSFRAYPSNGPADEHLFVDVARIGASGEKKILLVVSGTHGIEGFCGSACQIAVLRSSLFSSTQGITLYLIHALNPYGFAWYRRVNE